ncbi:glycosyltransferase involved in cell wall biosynthesis [Sphingobium francense]|nr:glycosyltransferase [Sphingobium indicum]NYI21866.1 glycosyltransferase involved in cell wall biosynthesis [Sphingobium indicum]
MTKIALVTYEMNQGGTNRVLCQLADGFAASGYETTILSCTSAGVLNAHFSNSLRQGVKTVSFSNVAWRSRSWGQVRTFFRYTRWLTETKPDIVLATGNNISWFTGIGALLAPTRTPRLLIKTTNPIIRERDSRFITAIRRRVYGALFRRAEKVLTLSDAETAMLQRQFAANSNKFTTVFNAYITQSFDRPGLTPAARSDRKVVAGVGRLVAQKNFPRLLRAFAQGTDENVILKIAGDGPDRKALEDLARELGIADRVHFLGFVQDIPALLADADLFILSSDYEGLPAVVVEALGCDCPVIATDCFANARDLLEGLPGCRVTELSAEALADALRDWLNADAPRPSLRDYAEPYTTASSVRSHLAAMRLSVA